MKSMWSAAIALVIASGTVGAQSGKMAGEPMMHDSMKQTYTGCVESVNHGAKYVLTHVADGDRMAMSHDAMKKSDGMMKDSGAMKDAPAAGAMHGDHMAPSAVALAGRTDLNKHVGQKVTVTGAIAKAMVDGEMKDQLDTLTVSSLKVVAKSCN
jgi:hypothetical protein